MFILALAVCGVLHGVGLVMLDLDICCRFSAENLKRVETALKDLHPYHRMTQQKLPLKLTDELCGRLKKLYLATDFGVLDCLGEVAGLGDYEQVLKHSIAHKMSYGEFRILSLDALITTKKAVGREKDLYAARLLRALRSKTE